MPRWYQKYIPTKESIKKNNSIQSFQRHLSYHYLWEIKKGPIARGVAVGVFIGLLPIPMQMLWALLLAIVLRANLPCSVAITWINNPFTFVPINYFIYKFGTLVTGDTKSLLSPPKLPAFKSLSLKHFYAYLNWFSSMGKSYLIGLVIVTVGLAIAGYLLVILIWNITNWYKHRK